MMDEMKKVQDLPKVRERKHVEWRKVQDLPKVRERKHAGTGGTTSRE